MNVKLHPVGDMLFADIPLSLIDDNPVQPVRRVTEIALHGLEGNIQRRGLIVPPVVAANSGRFTTIDGHRRILALHRAGKQSSVCRVVEEDPIMAFLDANSDTKRFDSAQFLQVWAAADLKTRPLLMKQFSSTVRLQINGVIRIAGIAGAELLAAEGKSPEIGGYPPVIYSTLFAWLSFAPLKVAPLTEKEIYEWLRVNGERRQIRAYLSEMERHPRIQPQTKALRARKITEGIRGGESWTEIHQTVESGR